MDETGVTTTLDTCYHTVQLETFVNRGKLFLYDSIRQPFSAEGSVHRVSFLGQLPLP